MAYLIGMKRKQREAAKRKKSNRLIETEDGFLVHLPRAMVLLRLVTAIEALARGDVGDLCNIETGESIERSSELWISINEERMAFFPKELEDADPRDVAFANRMISEGVGSIPSAEWFLQNDRAEFAKEHAKGDLFASMKRDFKEIKRRMRLNGFTPPPA